MTVVRGISVNGEPYEYEAHVPMPETQQERLGAELLALRKRAPKAPLSSLYDRHRAKLEAVE